MELLRLAADLVIGDAMHSLVVLTLGSSLALIGAIIFVAEGWTERAEVATVAGLITAAAALIGAQLGRSDLPGMIWSACVPAAIYAAGAWVAHTSRSDGSPCT